VSYGGRVSPGSPRRARVRRRLTRRDTTITAQLRSSASHSASRGDVERARTADEPAERRSTNALRMISPGEPCLSLRHAAASRGHDEPHYTCLGPGPSELEGSRERFMR